MIRPANENRSSMTFRLSGKARRELARQATSRHVSSSELCRTVLERHFATGDLRAVMDAIAEVSRRQDAVAGALEEALSGVEGEVAGLRRDFERALKAAR